MRPKLQIAVLSALVVALLAANLKLAFAMGWRMWHWHPPHPPITVFIWDQDPMGSHVAAAQAAIADWANQTGIDITTVGSGPADITVICANYGETPWIGLASIVDPVECTETPAPDLPHAAGKTVIVHARSRYNTYWDISRTQNQQVLRPPYLGLAGTGAGIDSDLRGILAQEIGHAFGVGHSENNCMGKGYYGSLPVVAPIIAGSTVPVPASNVVGTQNANDAKARIPPYH